MKRKVVLGALAWALFISFLHLHLNVGWGELTHRAKVLFGVERGQLLVGFLPVT